MGLAVLQLPAVLAVLVVQADPVGLAALADLEVLADREVLVVLVALEVLAVPVAEKQPHRRLVKKEK